MSDQLPPIDPDLRAHLARRSAGRLPDDLLAATYARLDVAQPQPRGFTLRRVPRLAVTGGALALITILAAALLVVPRSQVSPAAPGQWSYPADRALTSPELALLMSGPGLPTNTTLVASVTIDAKNDVCPMNRYPTIGVVEGMSSQVCVMGELAVRFSARSFDPLPGTYAFRYLAPGYLGLLGEITPASSSRISFRVTDDWPLTVDSFLVDGWLGAVGLTVSCASLEPSGDVLNPSGEDCPYDDWMGIDSTAPGIQADHESVLGSPLPSYDPLSRRGNARHVGAGGMRIIDSIDHAAPVHGVYVVRSIVEQCSGDPPQSSRGCSAWRILAKVAEISVPAPSGTPLGASTAAPTTAPPATPLAPSLTGVIGTGNRPLTADELETLMVEQPDHLAGRIVIVEAPIPTQISCQSDASGGGCAVNTKSLAGDGVWAVSIGADGTLSLVGEVTVPQSGFVFPLGQAVATWSKAGTEKQFFVVDAWIGGAGEVACDVVGSPCYEASWLGSTAAAREVDVQLGAYHEFGGGPVGGGAAIHGVFLVEWVPAATDCGNGQDTRSCTGLAHAQVVSRVETGAVP